MPIYLNELKISIKREDEEINEEIFQKLKVFE